MKKLLAILVLSALPLAAQANDDYYDQTCHDNARYSRDMGVWCDSYDKHKEHGESTKNDKANIEKLDKEMRAGRVDSGPPHAARYSDWDARERGNNPPPGYYPPQRPY